MGRGKQRRAPQAERVCRAWHRAKEVKVLSPGVRRAKGVGEGQGRHCEMRSEGSPIQKREASEATGLEVWYTQDELARDSEVLPLRLGCAL